MEKFSMIETVFNDSFCTYIVKQDNYLAVPRNVIADAQCFCSFKHVSGCIVNKPYAKVKTTISFPKAARTNFYFEEILSAQEYLRAFNRWNSVQPDNGCDERIYFMHTQIAGYNIDSFYRLHKPSLISIKIERV